MKAKETKMRTSVIKKTLLLALLLATSSAWAAWVQVAQTDAGDFYIDPETIRKDGNLVRVWEINNRKQRGEEGELSIRWRVEYDCKQERRRWLSLSAHSERMAGGTVLLSGTVSGNWSEIAPGTVNEVFLKIVCR